MHPADCMCKDCYEGSYRQEQDLKRQSMTPQEKLSGGPAFPHFEKPGLGTQFPSWVGVMKPGMTLRQWYAGMAMQGMANNYSLMANRYQEIAIEAFKQADAMLAHEQKESAQGGEGK